jgi:hypothetical protein
MNPSLAEYHVPVHLDVPEIEVTWTGISARQGQGMSNPLRSMQIVRYLPMRSATSTSPYLPNACSALSYSAASTGSPRAW